jgi:hypothetical protein
VETTVDLQVTIVVMVIVPLLIRLVAAVVVVAAVAVVEVVDNKNIPIQVWYVYEEKLVKKNTEINDIHIKCV